MKIVKLTATARADVEAARKRLVKERAMFVDLVEVGVQGSPSDSHLADSDVHPADKFLADTELWTKSSTEPTLVQFRYEFELLFGNRAEGTLILYQDCFYDVRGQFTSAQQRLLVLEAADKERQLFERLKAKFESPSGQGGTRARHRIPEAVRIEVWRRDQGRCATPGCGSRENLEYDHIIPIDAGGSNTARNVELLCEVCNRRKSNKIQ